MLNEINMLRDKLNEQLMAEASYEDIYNTSIRIDRLLIEYYSKEKAKIVC